MKVAKLRSLFQFQHGTIKAKNSNPSTTRNSLFQFQHGTIKAYAQEEADEAVANFNSNMVRLKHC